MLVLKRKVRQQILIGDEVEVTVLELTPGSVRLGIKAPEGVSVIRPEWKGARTDPLTAGRDSQP